MILIFKLMGVFWHLLGDHLGVFDEEKTCHSWQIGVLKNFTNLPKTKKPLQ